MSLIHQNFDKILANQENEKPPRFINLKYFWLTLVSNQILRIMDGLGVVKTISIDTSGIGSNRHKQIMFKRIISLKEHSCSSRLHLSDIHKNNKKIFLRYFKNLIYSFVLSLYSPEAESNSYQNLIYGSIGL